MPRAGADCGAARRQHIIDYHGFRVGANLSAQTAREAHQFSKRARGPRPYSSNLLSGGYLRTLSHLFIAQSTSSCRHPKERTMHTDLGVCRGVYSRCWCWTPHQTNAAEQQRQNWEHEQRQETRSSNKKNKRFGSLRRLTGARVVEAEVRTAAAAFQLVRLRSTNR